MELGDQRDRYAKRVEEIDELKAELGKLQSKLDEPTLSGEFECESCPYLARELAVLKEKFEGQLMELEEHRARPTLLGACMDLREEVLSLQNDNNRLREVLSWVYARQPQLEMIIESTKRAEGETSCVGFGECSTSGEKSAPIKVKTAPTQLGETVDGVYYEPPKAAPKKQYWTPKPSKAKLDKIVEEEFKPKGKKPIRRLEPPKATPPKPKSQPNPVPRRPVYHCEFCQRNGHLEEFCFRRKRVERHERAWGNQDQFYQGGRQDPPHHGEMRDRFAGGERGGGFQARAPGGERRFTGELLVVFSAAMDLVTEALRELSRVHALEVMDRGMEDVWIMDSDCSRHMTGHRKWFSSLNPVSTKEYITFGDNGQAFPREVAFVRNLGFNLVSFRNFSMKDLRFVLRKVRAAFLMPRRPLFALCRLLVGFLGSTSHPFLGPAHRLVASPSADIWKRLGQLSFDLLVRLSSMGLIRGLPKLRAEKGLVCHPCHHGKIVAASHIPVSQVMNSYPGELFHMDTVGPAQVASVSGKWYVLVVVDDFSRFSWFKDEAFGFVRDLVLRLRNESHKAMRAIRSDNGGEFRNSRFENFCRELGLEHQFSSPYTPSQNGIVERKNRTLVERARTMLDEHRTPRRFWVEAVNTAYEPDFLASFPWADLPSVNHLRAFGYRCFVLKKVGHLDKFESRCLVGIFLGYASSSRAFCVWILEAKQVVETCEVSFDETMPCTISAFELSGDDEEGTSIFEDEESVVNDGDAGATAPAAAPAPSTTSSDDEGGPLPTASSSPPRQEAHAQAGPAEDAGR
ncbi:LOW QUALITY PROTEIN: hypothetical protein U9M48_003927 [Paspalum notatum var. saurae]|uniref:Integrase catalytic domain-containing protein n=1 Tax=Paspalum notatum var. saurae TaxID=547442 RepID=A0AAQ3SED9_PASNO